MNKMAEENKVVIDATHATLGRLASYAAKQALLGKSLVILNCDEALITGRKREIIEKYQTMKKRGQGGSLKGPRVIKVPFRIVKRSIRGMLSHRQARGKEALKRIKCYNDIPEEYKDAKMIKSGKAKTSKHITLGELVKEI